MRSRIRSGRYALKVVDITEFYSQRGGGVRSHLTTKGHVLCQLGHEHLVIAPGPKNEEAPLTRGEPGSSRDPLPNQGKARVRTIRGPSLPYDPTYHLLGRIDKIRAIVRREDPDVVEIHSPYLAMAAGLSLPRQSGSARTFFWHADFIDTYFRPALEKRVSPRVADVLLEPIWKAVRALASRCDATIVAGRRQAEKLRTLGISRVVHIPFGVDRKTFAATARSVACRAEWIAKAGGDLNARLLVGVGRFAHEKRWDVVLEAFFKVRAKHNAVLVLFGDGPERDAMMAQTKGRNDVVFAGFERDRAKLAAALASADLLVHGCPYETFGLGVAEAMSAGLPVVVPDQGGASENVSPTSSMVYRSADSEECAAAIDRMLAQNPADLRARAMRAGDAIHSIEDHFRQTLALYDDLLRERQSPRTRGRNDFAAERVL